MSSATNFGLTVLVANQSSAAEFGAFALAMTVGITVITVLRGIAGDSLASGFAAADPLEFASASRAALATLLTAGVLLSLGIAGITVALPLGRTTDALLALSVVLPGVLVQDLVRSIYVVRGTPRAACLNDVAWAVLMVAAFLVMVGDGTSSARFLLAWGLCGTACALMGVLHLRLVPGWRAIRHWLQSTRHMWPYFLSDNALLQLTLLATTAVVALYAGLNDVAGLRAVILLFGPVIVLAQAVSLFAVPEIARQQATGRSVRRSSAVIGFGLAAICLMIGVIAYLLPPEIGADVMGETWTYTRPLIGFATIDSIGAVLVLGCSIGLRAIAAGKHVLYARVITALGRLAVTTVGAVLAGAYGALGFAAAFAPISVAIWWHQLNRATGSTSGLERPSIR